MAVTSSVVGRFASDTQYMGRFRASPCTEGNRSQHRRPISLMLTKNPKSAIVSESLKNMEAKAKRLRLQVHKTLFTHKQVAVMPGLLFSSHLSFCR